MADFWPFISVDGLPVMIGKDEDVDGMEEFGLSLTSGNDPTIRKIKR